MTGTLLQDLAQLERIAGGTRELDPDCLGTGIGVDGLEAVPATPPTGAHAAERHVRSDHPV